MSFSLITVVFFLIGFLVYGAIVFWSGKRGMWWLAVLVTLPAIVGGLMSLSVDFSASSSPLFRNFGWLAVGQMAIGVFLYGLGRSKSQSANNNSKDLH